VGASVGVGRVDISLIRNMTSQGYAYLLGYATAKPWYAKYMGYFVEVLFA